MAVNKSALTQRGPTTALVKRDTTWTKMESSVLVLNASNFILLVFLKTNYIHSIAMPYIEEGEISPDRKLVTRPGLDGKVFLHLLQNKLYINIHCYTSHISKKIYK